MAVEIHLMSGYAPKEAFARLAPLFEQSSGTKLVFHYSVLAAIQEKLAAGERPDVIIMPVRLIDDYVTQGIANAIERGALGIVRTGVAAKATAEAPDLSSLETFRDADFLMGKTERRDNS